MNTAQVTYELDWEPHEAQGDFVNDTRPIVGFVGGLGAGKTLAGWVRAIQMQPSDGLGVIVAPTYRQLHDGVLGTALEHFRPFLADVNKSEMRVKLVTGAEILLRSSTRPDDFRSINAGWLWLDEACYHSRYALTTIMARVRYGCERIWWTSSPVKGSPAHDIFVQSDRYPWHHAPSWANPYLSEQYLELMRSTMSAREAAREIDAEWVEAGGVLWEQETISATRRESTPALSRYVVGVDPAMTSKRKSDQTGIVLVGQGSDGHAYVLRDLSGIYAPHQWGRVVCDLCRQYGAMAVCETNAGGDLVEANLRMVDPSVPFRGVRAGSSKAERAAPIATLYTSGWVHHVGDLRDLERQMTTWEPSDPDSPDRMDALVWAVTELQIYPHAPSPDRIERTVQRKVRI
jgi:phage terminase large subunit-like protein